MTGVFFTSDTHFGHAFVAQLRGYPTPTEHDEAIVTVWNATVSKRDVVWHLGDVTLRNITHLGPLLGRLNGTIHLVAGNHDACHPMRRDAHRRQHAYLEAGFASVASTATARVGAHRVAMSHFPYTGEGARDQPDRDVQWRLRDLGAPLIHGHTHDAGQRLTFSPTGAPMVHVGWDAWAAPVPAEAVAALLDATSGA